MTQQIDTQRKSWRVRAREGNRRGVVLKQHALSWWLVAIQEQKTHSSVSFDSLQFYSLIFKTFFIFLSDAWKGARKSCTMWISLFLEKQKSIDPPPAPSKVLLVKNKTKQEKEKKKNYYYTSLWHCVTKISSGFSWENRKEVWAGQTF